jgi:histidine triad (HIT) family protein
MADCIFCKLANGEIPTTKLYEDEEFTVIPDAGPASKGHCLILPKAHYANIYEMPEDLTQKAFLLAKRMASRLVKATDCDGFNIVQNNGEAAGQSVFHFHIHLIPRYKGEPPIVANWTPHELTDKDREELAARFEAAAEE